MSTFTSQGGTVIHSSRNSNSVIFFWLGGNYIPTNKVEGGILVLLCPSACPSISMLEQNAVYLLSLISNIQYRHPSVHQIMSAL